jgi:predicted XRE-type DNA-binding protein
MEDLSSYLSVLKQHGYSKDEAIILLMRLQLIKIIRAEIRRRNWSQREAAKIIGVAQPRIAEISALATEKFSLEALIKYLHRLDLKPTLSVKPGKHYSKPKRQRKPASARPGTTKKGAIKPTTQKL